MNDICSICEEEIAYDEPSVVNDENGRDHLSCSISEIDDMGETSYDGDCC